ncbi:MAG: hypothetical protein GY938_07360 [Ketobacter sp.]|nr:hypothetical protein [Ketobacter sp.]
MSLEECLLLQGFPRTMLPLVKRFEASTVRRLIGNSMHPAVMGVVTAALLSTLKR